MQWVADLFSLTYSIDSDPNEFSLATMETQGRFARHSYVRLSFVRGLVRSNTNPIEFVPTS